MEGLQVNGHNPLLHAQVWSMRTKKIAFDLPGHMDEVCHMPSVHTSAAPAAVSTARQSAPPQALAFR